MRFLADESCDFAAVRALRGEGHDVLAVSEFQQRSVDKEVVELALAESRILLTEDKDFGWLAFVAHAESPGVILIRFPASARALLPPAVLKRSHAAIPPAARRRKANVPPRPGIDPARRPPPPPRPASARPPPARPAPAPGPGGFTPHPSTPRA